jgi:hypothetical protein
MELFRSGVLFCFWLGVLAVSCKKECVKTNVEGCLSGTFITWSCPGGITVVDGIGNNLGVAWDYNGVHYDNAICLAGSFGSSTYSLGSRMYFSIDFTKQPKDCLIALPCPFNVNPAPGGTVYCFKTLSQTSCYGAD